VRWQAKGCGIGSRATLAAAGSRPGWAWENEAGWVTATVLCTGWAACTSSTNDIDDWAEAADVGAEVAAAGCSWSSSDVA